MNKRRICFIITTRGNYAKLKPVIIASMARNDVEKKIIVAGGALLSKYGNIVEAVEREFFVDRRISYIIEGENLLSMAKSAGIAVSEFANVFENMKPDCVVLVGDRYETLAIAMAAAYMNIPIAHIEGGEVSGSIDESVRHALTKMSHLHFPSCTQGAQRIIKLGEPPETVFTTGATSLDSMIAVDLKNISSLVEAQKTIGVGPLVNLIDGYLLVLFHPVTTEYQRNRNSIKELIEAVDNLKLPTIWLWPNMDAGADIVSQRIRAYRELKSPKHVHYFKSLPIELFAPALYNCSCILGNSSSGIRESAFFGIPSVNIGSRQDGRDKGNNVIDVPEEKQAIQDAVHRQIEHGKYPQEELYGNGKTSKKIARVLATFNIVIQKRITY